MGRLPLESMWHLKIERTFPSTDLASLPASERRAAEPAVSHRASPRPHPAASGAERDHLGPGECPELLPFLPSSRAPPSLLQQQGGAAPGPLLSPGFRGRALLFTGSHPVPLGLRPRSASTSLAKVPSTPACSGEASSLSSPCRRQNLLKHVCETLRRSAQLCRHTRDFSGILGAHLGNMVLGSSPEAHEGDTRRGNPVRGRRAGGVETAEQKRRGWLAGWVRAGRWLQAGPRSLEAGVGTSSLGAF